MQLPSEVSRMLQQPVGSAGDSAAPPAPHVAHIIQGIAYAVAVRLVLSFISASIVPYEGSPGIFTVTMSADAHGIAHRCYAMVASWRAA